MSINGRPNENVFPLLAKGLLLNTYGHPIVASAEIVKVKKLTNPSYLHKTINADGTVQLSRALQSNIVELMRDLDFHMADILYHTAIPLSEEEKIQNECMLKMGIVDFIKHVDVESKELVLGYQLARKGYMETRMPAKGLNNSDIPEVIMYIGDPPLQLLIEKDIQIKSISQKGVGNESMMCLSYELNIHKKPKILLERNKE